MMEVPTSNVERTNRYKDIILDAWEGIRVSENKVKDYYYKIAPLLSSIKKVSIPMSKEESDVLRAFLSAVTGLWGDLRPMMKGKDKENEFKSYSDFCDRLDLTIKDVPKARKLMAVLRDALETLEITRIDKEQK
jgi:hypothetical protein